MRRPNRYCLMRMKPKMSWHSANCYITWNWSPLNERTMNNFQIQAYAKAHCRLFFNGDVSARYFKRVFQTYKKDIFATIAHMERRIDNVVFRSMFASSIFAARKMVANGAIAVNGVVQRAASFALADGDILQVVPGAAHLVYARPSRHPFAKMWAFVPAYLEVSWATLSTAFVRQPVFDEVPHPFPLRMVRELGAFYYLKS